MGRAFETEGKWTAAEKAKYWADKAKEKQDTTWDPDSQKELADLLEQQEQQKKSL